MPEVMLGYNLNRHVILVCKDGELQSKKIARCQVALAPNRVIPMKSIGPTKCKILFMVYLFIICQLYIVMNDQIRWRTKRQTHRRYRAAFYVSTMTAIFLVATGFLVVLHFYLIEVSRICQLWEVLVWIYFVIIVDCPALMLALKFACLHIRSRR